MHQYLALPEEASKICVKVNAPPRLVAHLTLVHDVSIRLVDNLQKAFPDFRFDRESVLFGAATHDIGKATYVNELSGPGKLHEAHGRRLLMELGVPEPRSRFAYSHGNWDDNAEIQVEDLFVALADNCWKGKRNAELEDRIVNEIARQTGRPEWDVFSALDDILQGLTVDADERLVWQAQFSVSSANK
jgi:hypothetical protein